MNGVELLRKPRKVEATISVFITIAVIAVVSLACGGAGLPPGVLPPRATPTPEVATITWDDVELTGDIGEDLFASVQYVAEIDVTRIISNEYGTEARGTIVGSAEREVNVFLYGDNDITTGNRYRARLMLYSFAGPGITTFQIVEYELVGPSPEVLDYGTST
jgi:hypothetical protein